MKLISMGPGHLARRGVTSGRKRIDATTSGVLWVNAVGKANSPTRRPRADYIPIILKEMYFGS